MEPHDDFERANAKEWDEQSSITFESSSKQLSNYERVNAKEWDKESTFSSTLSTAERAALDDDESPLLLDFDDLPRLPPQRQQFIAARFENKHRENFPNNTGHPGPVLSHGALSQTPASQQHPGIGYDERSRHRSSSPRKILIADVSRQQRDGATTGRQNRSRRGDPRNKSKPSSTKQVWAEPTGLITTRRAKDLEDKAKKELENKKYLRRPIDEERILTYGFYIWPQEDGSVPEVLGLELELLNPIRMHHKVYIEWVQVTGTQDLLKISSESSDLEKHVALAIKGIRSAIEHVKARVTLAAPKYFVVPPTASAMRAVVCPKQVITKKEILEGVEKTKNTTCIGTQLIGKKLSGQEKETWRKRRVLDYEKYVKEFEGRLSSNLTELAALKGWMRMRVHFGHLILKRFPSEYAASRSTFDQFVQMMGLSQLRGEIEKMIPAAVAMKLRKKIVDWPERFRPGQGCTLSLKDVSFKDTEIISVITEKGHDLRVEADIDVTYDEDGFVTHQTGSYCVFRDDESNKRVVLSVVDPERQVDYALQVITDGIVVITEATKDFDKLIEGSIPVKTRVRYDALGLPYPEVHPQSRTGLQIQKIVVRSLIQYALINSGYVIEIAFYRTWYHNTRSEPTIAASVSMFHPQWDLQMESIENKTDERRWHRGLSTFFDNGIDQESNGFENFLAEVATIQGFLTDAANETEMEAAEIAAK